MPSKHKAGCTCCGGACRATIEYDSASFWTAGAGGSVTYNGGGSNEVELDGDVDPNSLPSADAYLITFTATGQGTLTIGTIDVSFDADAQTLTLDGTSVDCGQSTKTPLELDIGIRVTPSHIAAYAIGNYTFTGIGRGYGIRTVDRTGSVPTSIAGTWTSATLTDFFVADSSVEVTGTSVYDEEVVKNCFTGPSLNWPYKLLKDVTNNHEYQDGGGAGTGDVLMPDATYTGPDLRADNVDSPFWGVNKTTPIADDIWNESTSLPSANWQSAFADTGITAIAAQWGGNELFGYDRTTQTIHEATIGCGVEWLAPSLAEPYPKPEFEVASTRKNVSTGVSTFAETNIAVNDLSTGWTVSATQDSRTIQWDYP